jgi:L-lactate dehydrogenase
MISLPRKRRSKDIVMSSHRTRISIIGCGHVGTSCAYAILQSHLAREIVLIGHTEDLVHGEAMDLQQSVPLGTPIDIFAGTYKDAASSSIAILTVGTPALGELKTRLRPKGPPD